MHENCHPADRALLNIPLSLLNSSLVHFILYAFKLAFSYKLEHVLVTTTKYLILPNFIVFFNPLNIQLIPYSCRVGIKTSRCIHKKTEWHQASLLNLVFPLHRVQYKKQGELRPPPCQKIQEKAAYQQLNTSQTTNTFIVMRSLFLTEFSCTEMFRSKILCINGKQITFKRSVYSQSSTSYKFKFQQFSCLEALQYSFNKDFGSTENWRHCLCLTRGFKAG